MLRPELSGQVEKSEKHYGKHRGISQPYLGRTISKFGIGASSNGDTEAVSCVPEAKHFASAAQFAAPLGFP